MRKVMIAAAASFLALDLGACDKAVPVSHAPTPSAGDTHIHTPPPSAAPNLTITSNKAIVSTPHRTECQPLTSRGNCYKPGEICPKADHGITGIDANGDAIACKDNDGWRWEAMQ